MQLHTVRGKLITTILCAILAVVVFIAAPHVMAQSSTDQSNEQGGGNNLRVSPLRTDVVIEPGQTRSITIYVQSLEDKVVTLKPIQNDFVAGDEETGAPSIILDEDKFAPTHSLKRFLTPLDTITVQPNERKAVELTITVPEDAQAGGYFGALRFAPSSLDGSEIVNVSGSVASLVLLTVPGNLVESLEMKTFDIMQDGKKVSRLSSPDKVSVSIRLENKGNVQVAPFGDVFISKGDKQLASAKINDIQPAGVVLPDSVRKWEVPAEKLGNFGKYKISATIGYGSSGQTINVERTIWVIPTMYIVGAIAAVIIFIGLVLAIFFGLRSYKRRILRRARRR